MKKMPLTIELEPGTYHWCGMREYEKRAVLRWFT